MGLNFSNGYSFGADDSWLEESDSIRKEVLSCPPGMFVAGVHGYYYTTTVDDLDGSQQTVSAITSFGVYCRTGAPASSTLMVLCF